MGTVETQPPGLSPNRTDTILARIVELISPLVTVATAESDVEADPGDRPRLLMVTEKPTISAEASSAEVDVSTAKQIVDKTLTERFDAAYVHWSLAPPEEMAVAVLERVWAAVVPGGILAISHTIETPNDRVDEAGDSRRKLTAQLLAATHGRLTMLDVRVWPDEPEAVVCYWYLRLGPD